MMMQTRKKKEFVRRNKRANRIVDQYVVIEMKIYREWISLKMDEERKRADEDALKYRPFNIQWLDSSYQQTCLPDSPWQKVSQFEWFLSTKQKQN